MKARYTCPDELIDLLYNYRTVECRYLYRQRNVGQLSAHDWKYKIEHPHFAFLILQYSQASEHFTVSRWPTIETHQDQRLRTIYMRQSKMEERTTNTHHHIFPNCVGDHSEPAHSGHLSVSNECAPGITDGELDYCNFPRANNAIGQVWTASPSRQWSIAGEIRLMLLHFSG